MSPTELFPGDTAKLGGKTWLVVAREPIDDKIWHWMYTGEMLHAKYVQTASVDDRKVKASGE